MNIPKTWVILLVLSLAAMAMVPMVSAAQEQNPNTATSEELNAVSLNQSKTQLPQLQYDKNQKKVIVNGEFKVSGSTQSSQIAARITTSATPIESSIPFGAIVHHSNDGVTTVFDSTGKQLFAAEDAAAPLINTPNGVLPATKVFEVPDQSLIVDDQSIINVFYEKNRILTIISESGSEKQSLIPLQQGLNRWIEYGETGPISTVGQFSARWNVPKNPTMYRQYTPGDSLDGTVSTIWNGLETSDENYLLQPVLEWYVRDKATAPYPTIANWSIATWYVPNGNGFHSTRRYGIPSTGELILTGQQIQGNMMYSGATWTGAITDLTLGVSSTLSLNSSMSSQLTYHNLQAYTVLEGWNPNLPSLNPLNYNSSYIPGNVTFDTITINDIYGNNVIPTTIDGHVNSATWSTTNYGLSVTNSTWPTSIKLNTGNI